MIVKTLVAALLVAVGVLSGLVGALMAKAERLEKESEAHARYIGTLQDAAGATHLRLVNLRRETRGQTYTIQGRGIQHREVRQWIDLETGEPIGFTEWRNGNGEVERALTPIPGGIVDTLMRREGP